MPRDRASAVCDFYTTRFPRIMTFEFSRDRKMMSVLVRRPEGGAYLFVKGAPESVLSRCTSMVIQWSSCSTDTEHARAPPGANSHLRSKWLTNIGTRILRNDNTDRSHYQPTSTADYARFEHDLTFVSLVGMLDPPRPEVKHAIANCKAAGIRVMCITGDNKGTAETICRQIGIFGEDEDLDGKSYTGREWDALRYGEKILAVQRASLFSRTEPGHKLELVAYSAKPRPCRGHDWRYVTNSHF